MNKQEIFDKLRPIIVDKLAVQESEVALEKSLSELRADSLDAVELFMEVEKQFALPIPDNDMEKFTNVQSIVDYIHDHQSVPETSASE